MTPVDESRMNTLAAMLADQKRELDYEQMEACKARVALGRHRHSTATLAEDIERIVRRLDEAEGKHPTSLLSGAALREIGVPHTPAGALHTMADAAKPGDDDEADERALWREVVLASVRNGNSPLSAAKEAAHIVAEWRRQFAVARDGSPDDPLAELERAHPSDMGVAPPADVPTPPSLRIDRDPFNPLRTVEPPMFRRVSVPFPDNDPHRTPYSPIPPRTVFVNPFVFYSIAKRYAGPPPESLLHVTLQWRPTPRVEVDAADGPWSILAAPDCPIDYPWPVMGSPEYAAAVPPEVAEVVRQGIADAKERV